MTHRPRPIARLAATLVALAALAVALAPAPAGAASLHFREGSFVGTTGLDHGEIELKVVRKRSGLFVRHIVLEGSFDCYGYPEDVHIDRYVSGVKVGALGGFRIPDADVNLRGHYATSGRIEGSLIAKTLSCDSPREHFVAKRGG